MKIELSRRIRNENVDLRNKYKHKETLALSKVKIVNRKMKVIVNPSS